jgi:hypothetical protein
METEVLLADDVPELTVRDTNKATLSFSDARLIGPEHNYATVYRVVLPGGMAAAAKRLDRADALRLLGRHRRRVIRRPRESQKRERHAFDRPRVGPMMWAQDGWVSRGRVIKTLQFWQKRSPNCDFHCRSTFLIIMQPDGWAQREG